MGLFVSLWGIRRAEETVPGCIIRDYQVGHKSERERKEERKEERTRGMERIHAKWKREGGGD